MRKLILLAVAFLLLAAPAYAAVTAEVTVNIDWLHSLEITDNCSFNLTAGDINATYATDVDAIGVDGYSNDDWELWGNRDAWDNGAPWGLKVDAVVFTAVGTDYLVLDAQTATGDITTTCDVTITGLGWGNCGSGDDDACTLTFSMLQDT